MCFKTARTFRTRAGGVRWEPAKNISSERAREREREREKERKKGTKRKEEKRREEKRWGREGRRAGRRTPFGGRGAAAAAPEGVNQTAKGGGAAKRSPARRADAKRGASGWAGDRGDRSIDRSTEPWCGGTGQWRERGRRTSEAVAGCACTARLPVALAAKSECSVAGGSAGVGQAISRATRAGCGRARPAAATVTAAAAAAAATAIAAAA